MDAAPIVVAFSDSVPLRETLSVLLEHDCDLRQLRADDVGPVDSLFADLAVVAARRAAPLLELLTHRWPTLPIIRVALGESDEPAPRPTGGSQVHDVPFEPHAIRGAVLRELARQPNAPLRAAVRHVAGTLQHELTYAWTALRAFSAWPAASPDAATDAIFGAVLREQSYVLAEHVGHLESFRDRPRSADWSPAFVATLCAELARPDALTTQRGMLFDCVVDAGAPFPSGPVTLVPVLAPFLRSHVRRHADAAAIRVDASRTGVVLRYPRRSGATTSDSWPLLLAALALQPWSWFTARTVGDGEERITLRPTS